MSVREIPVRLCCGQRHYGVVCPDGKVMCELCYGRFDTSLLNVTADGTKENVCANCARQDIEAALDAKAKDDEIERGRLR